VAALVVMCAAVRVHPWSMLGILVTLAAAVIAGWHVVTRRGLARVVAGLTVLVAVVAPVLHVLAHRPGASLAAMVLFGFSMASARFALRPAGRRPRRGGRRRGAQVTGAGRAVLLLNPRSGSGEGGPPRPRRPGPSVGADVLPMRRGDDLSELARSTRLNFTVPAPGAARVTGFCCTRRGRPRSLASCHASTCPSP
jgi:hypothetical protein